MYICLTWKLLSIVLIRCCIEHSIAMLLVLVVIICNKYMLVLVALGLLFHKPCSFMVEQNTW